MKQEVNNKIYIAAQFYAKKLHIPIFPLKPRGKEPLTPHGCNDATTNEAQIKKWWTRWPDANIGLATGNGIIVLDVDIDHDSGKYGDETLEDLEQEYGPLPDTWEVLTGSGGRHLYFSCNDPALTIAAGFAPGLDYRGAGGYVVAPPSIHPNGNTYEWEVSHTPANYPLAPLPDWLHGPMLGKKREAESKKFEIPEQISSGSRNDTLFRMASSLRAKGYTEHEILSLLKTANSERCNPPLSEHEIETIAASARKYDIGKLDSDIKESVVDKTLTFTLEEIESGEAFKYLSGIKDPYSQGMELERLSKIAKSVKFDGFKKMFGRYIASIQKSKEPISEAEDSKYSEFENQPIELFTGEWRADNTGVWRYENNGKEYACSHPIMPVQILRSVDTRRFKVKLIFKRGGNRSKKPWDEATVGMEELSSPSEIVKALAPYGVSITGGKRAYAMIDYLRDIMDWNIDTIPEIKSVSRMGWNEEGFFPYTSGKEIAYDSAEQFNVVYKSIRKEGSFEFWLEEARGARAFSLTARIVLAASFAAPLIEPLGCSSFFVHLWGGTETGKTVAQMVAAAVWAYPVRGRGFFQTFDSTSVGLEMIAGFLHSLPLFVDETQQAKDKNGNIQFNVYNLTSESGRLRSNKALGLNYTPTWKTCFITSGEGPIVSEKDGEGALNRAFEIECYDGVKVIEDGHKTAEIVRNNYGWAGEIFIKKLAEEGNIERAKLLYEDYFKTMLGNDTTEKQAMAASAILTADKLATEWIFQDNKAITDKEIAEFLKSRKSVSKMERDYQTISDWVVENIKLFQGAEPETVGYTCYGIINSQKFPGYVCIIKSAFDRICEEKMIDTKPFLSHLKSRGLIQVGKRGFTMTTYIGMGQSASCVRLKLPQNEEESEIVQDDGMEIL